jgi:hypothetical protein
LESLAKFADEGFAWGRALSEKKHANPASNKLTRNRNRPAERTERSDLSKAGEWEKNMRTRIV